VGIGEADLSQDVDPSTLFHPLARPTPMPRILSKLACLVVFAAAIQAKAQQGTIEPTWIYTTPLHWKHAPRGIESSETFATVVVLYPEGQYLEIDGALIKNDKNPTIGFSHGDGLLYRAGTWERTDDHVIRTQSRDVFWSTETVSKSKCDSILPDHPCHFEEPHPGPIIIDTCGLEGQSPTQLAKTIHCKQLILQPSRLKLDLSELQRMAAIAFRQPQRN
jgi:hypothetical protein